jgi:hypothetical protein
MNRVSENDDDETIYCVMQTRTNLASCLRTAQVNPHKWPVGFSTVAAAGLAILRRSSKLTRQRSLKVTQAWITDRST